MIRYALVETDAAQTGAYLPDNYSTIYEDVQDTRHSISGELIRSTWVTVIQGRDVAGWTLDGYVLPRLASGLIAAREIDLSHPIMKLVEETR